MDSRPGKVLENKHRSLKVLELNLKSILFVALFKKMSYMCCQRQKETALMIEGGDGVARKKNLARVLMRSLEPCAEQFP